MFMPFALHVTKLNGPVFALPCTLYSNEVAYCEVSV